MKMKILFFLVIILLSFSQLLSQTQEVESEENTFKPNYDFFSKNMLSVEAAGKGYTGVADTGNISKTNINPASLEVMDDAQIYYEYGTKNDIDMFEMNTASMMLQKNKSGVCTGFAYRISNSLQAGLLYNKKSSYIADYGYIYNYDNNGVITDVFHIYEKAEISSISLPITYKHNDKLRFGIGLDLNIFHSISIIPCLFGDQTYYCQNGEIDFTLFRPRLGIIYNPLRTLLMGFTFTPESKKKIIEEILWHKYEYEANTFPMEIVVGAKYSLPGIPLDLLVDLKYSNESGYTEFKDRNDFHVGIEYDLLSNLQIRSGFFTQFDYRNMDYTVEDGSDYWLDTESYDKNYITFGLSYLWKRIKFDFAVMDSKLFSDSNMAQTHIKASCLLELIEN